MKLKEGRKWYVGLCRNFTFQRHDRKRDISQETTSEKGVVSESSQVSRRLSHKFFPYIQIHWEDWEVEIGQLGGGILSLFSKSGNFANLPRSPEHALPILDLGNTEW